MRLVVVFLPVGVDFRPPQAFELAALIGKIEKPLLVQEIEGGPAERLAQAALFGRRLASGFRLGRDLVDGGNPLRQDELGMALREGREFGEVVGRKAIDVPANLPAQGIVAVEDRLASTVGFDDQHVSVALPGVKQVHHEQVHHVGSRSSAYKIRFHLPPDILPRRGPRPAARTDGTAPGVWATGSIPGRPATGSPALGVRPAPLLEEERDAGGETEFPDLARPIGVHRPRARAAVEVEMADRPDQGFQQQEASEIGEAGVRRVVVLAAGGEEDGEDGRERGTDCRHPVPGSSPSRQSRSARHALPRGDGVERRRSPVREAKPPGSDHSKVVAGRHTAEHRLCAGAAVSTAVLTHRPGH